MSPQLGLLILLITPLTPLVLCGALLIWPKLRLLTLLAPWAAVPALLTSWLMIPGIAATVPWLLQGSEFGLDTISRHFLFFSSAIWLCAGLWAQHWPAESGKGFVETPKDYRQARFFSLFLLVMSGNFGLIIARDILAFYLFFSVMSIAAYGLVVHSRSQRARHAGRVYMTFVMAGDMLLLVALMLATRDTQGLLLFEAVRGNLESAPDRHLVVSLVLLGFGIKAGLLGVHVALPLIYRAAPLPATLVLAGAMLNAGLLGWMRFLPWGVEGFAGWGRFLMAVGTVTAFLGAAWALSQRHWKVVLAYSSISQMGLVLIGLGLALGNPEHAEAILLVLSFYALHHAFAKTALFMGGALVRRSQGKPYLRLARLALALPALAICGAPLTSGMLAKDALKHSLALAPTTATVQLLLPWMSLATTLIIGRFWFLVCCSGKGAAPESKALPRAVLALWLGMVLLSAVAPWLLPITPDLAWWEPALLWASSWPVLLGAFIALAAFWLYRQGRMPTLPQLPAGDLLVLLEWLSAFVIRGWIAMARQLLPALRQGAADRLHRIAKQPLWPRLLDRGEAALGQWSLGISLLPVIVLVLAALAIWL